MGEDSIIDMKKKIWAWMNLEKDRDNSIIIKMKDIMNGKKCR